MDNLSLVKVEWSKHRERLKEPIERIGKLANDHELFTNTDKACSNEWAFLFLAPDGFCILRPRYQRETSYVDIVVAYTSSGNAMAKYLPCLITLARKGNADHIRFYSVRKGFEKVAVKFGWKKYGYHRNFAIWRYKL